MALTGKEEGHVKVSSVRMTSLTTVYLRQLLCRGQAGRPTCFWSGYPLCCFKGASNRGAPDSCLPFYITIKAGETCGWCGWEVICWATSGSETLPPAVALLMGQVAEDQPRQTSHHSCHPRWVLMLTVLRGSCVVKVPGLLLEVFIMAMLNPFPPSGRSSMWKSPSREKLCLFPVCVSEFNVFKEEEGVRDLNLKRGIRLWVSLKPHLVFFLMGKIVLDFIKKNLNCSLYINIP